MNTGKEKRSGSETRRRRHLFVARLNDEEKKLLHVRCDGSGSSAGALFRNLLLSAPLPRHRRPRADQVAIAAVIAELQSVAAELGKQGSNLNQLAYHANADRMPPGMAELLADALEEHAEQGRTLLEMRDACLSALGFANHDD